MMEAWKWQKRILVLSISPLTIFQLERDIMNPQYEQYATFSEQSNNPNESGSAIMAVLVSAIVFIAALFLSSKSNEGVWLKLAIVTLAMAAIKVFTYLSKIKAFYKEKQ